MKLRIKDALIYFVSISLLIYFVYFSINSLNKKPIEIINFIDSNIHEDFEFDITNNLDDINKYLDEYTFIESHLLKKENNKIYIQLNLKEVFAINYMTKEIIFYDIIKKKLTKKLYFSLKTRILVLIILPVIFYPLTIIYFNKFQDFLIMQVCSQLARIYTKKLLLAGCLMS